MAHEEAVIVASGRISARLSRPLAEFVDSLVGDAGLYETPSEYVRDLIRRDMEQREGRTVRDAILSGYRDLADGAVFASTGDFQQDMQVLTEKEAAGWR
jgi:antitoxin ParD1/3/4